MAPRAAALLSCSGVLERHPDLDVVFGRGQRRLAGWTCTLSMSITKLTLPSAGRSRRWTQLPSYYIRRQIHATFQSDPVGLANLPLTGPDCLLVGQRLSAPESTFPHSNEGPRRVASRGSPMPMHQQ